MKCVGRLFTQFWCNELAFGYIFADLHLGGNHLLAENVPATLAPILNDAEQAVAEGDVYAGFYHLRTMVEHYIKGRLQIPFEQQVRGDELITKHYQMILPAVSSVLPSLTAAWERLSQLLHTRTGAAKDFQIQRDQICKHIEALIALSDDALTPKSQETLTNKFRPTSSLQAEEKLNAHDLSAVDREPVS